MNIQISKKVSIGFGMFIPHGNVVINSTAVIGDNFTICQFSTIGSVNGKAAKIGNNVYVGPGVSIVEDIEIKDNIVIGAGAVVVKDIKSNSIVCGVPARKIKELSSGNINKFTHNYISMNEVNF